MATTAELIAQTQAALAVAIAGGDVDVKIGQLEVKGSQKVGQLLEILRNLQQPPTIAVVSFDDRVDQFGAIR